MIKEIKIIICKEGWGWRGFRNVMRRVYILFLYYYENMIVYFLSKDRWLSIVMMILIIRGMIMRNLLMIVIIRRMIMRDWLVRVILIVRRIIKMFMKIKRFILILEVRIKKIRIVRLYICYNFFFFVISVFRGFIM